MTEYNIIDEASWKRAAHCAAFRDCIEPMYCVTFELDITKFLEKVRKAGYHFTLAMIYATAECANGIEAFRYRFLDGRVVLYKRINTSFTYLDSGGELFKVVNAEMKNTMREYVLHAKATAEAQTEYFTGPPRNDVFLFSPIPWVSYTHISHTNSGRKDNAVPMFDWGGYFERDSKTLIPFSVQAHHSFVDGVHIGMLAERLQEYLDKK